MSKRKKKPDAAEAAASPTDDSEVSRLEAQLEEVRQDTAHVREVVIRLSEAIEKRISKLQRLRPVPTADELVRQTELAVLDRVFRFLVDPDKLNLNPEPGRA